MNEEEAKAVEELKNCCLFWEGQYISSDKEEDRKMAEKEIAINRTLLNLLEKKDVTIIETKEANRQLSIELQKKDKIIDLMAEKLKQLREASLEDCFIPRSYRDIDDCLKTTCEDCIKQYFERKVENGN